jgi:hypothetical protein
MPAPTVTPPSAFPLRSVATDENAYVVEVEAWANGMPVFGAQVAAVGVFVEASGVQTALDRTAAAASEVQAVLGASAATAAASASAASAAVYANFDLLFLGSKAANPATDNSGGVLLVGATYFNTVAHEARVWTGAAWIQATAGAGYMPLVGGTFTGPLEIGSALQLSGDISPAQITANQNDYNPAGLANATILRLSTDAARNVTGLQGGLAGRPILIINTGAFDLVLKDADAGSTAANRFDIGGDLLLATKQGCALVYDATSSRWRLVGAPRSTLAPDVIIQDQLSAQALTAATWNTRQLNTVVRNQGSLAVLSSNQITLPAGTYLLRGRAALKDNSNSTASGKLRFYNVTDAAAITPSGDAVTSISTADAATGTTVVKPVASAEVVATVTLTGSKAIRLEMYASATAIGGGGAGGDAIEVYATVEITKIG